MTVGGQAVVVSGEVILLIAKFGERTVADVPVLGIFRTPQNGVNVGLVAAYLMLESTNGDDDIVVVATGDHSRPGGVFGRVRIAVRIIRESTHVLPFAFASILSGEALHVTIAVGKEDFTVFAPLCDGGPTGLERLNANFGFFTPFFTIEEVVAATTVGSGLVGFV